MFRDPSHPWSSVARAAVLAVLLAAAAGAPAQTPGASAPSAPQTVRPEVGKPLTAAQEAIKAGNYKDALAKIAEAESKPDLTAWEQLVISRTKAPAAYGAGDSALALASFETSLASPMLPAADRRLILETTIKLAVQMKDMARAARWLKSYISEGGNDPALRQMYPQVLGLTGDHAAAVTEAKAIVQANDAAGKPSSDALLRSLGASANAIKDEASYQFALEHLVVSSPRPDYWADLISRVARRPGFADERLRLDTYRLMQAVGVELEGEEFVEIAERAQQAGQPIEALKALDSAKTRGLLGPIKNQAGLAKLRDQVSKAAGQDLASLDDSEKSALAAREGNAAVNVGLALLAAGRTERAVALMQQGLAKGGLRRADEAQLRLGMALALAGRADEADRAFAAVGGSDGAADLARLWTLHLKSQPKK